ncbi:hypothetical protein ACFZB9_34075 [Kitasatospora sp. NPDC008050]|uniref:hypothetical protein n=1 Tax=Kitasatospora sp. NPDC008050 TaxID=3364021 RepID=UPI0036DFFE19
MTGLPALNGHARRQAPTRCEIGGPRRGSGYPLRWTQGQQSGLPGAEQRERIEIAPAS